jgi:hypothetical protein
MWSSSETDEKLRSDAALLGPGVNVVALVTHATDGP